MEQIRDVHPSSEESALPELAFVEPATKKLTLREWVEIVSSPGVTREDVESLLAGLSGPLVEGESTRERADQLLRLLQDEALGALTGGDGREVRPAALEALLALGFPYALEVPPEVLSRMRGNAPRVLSRMSRWGLGLGAMGALAPLVAVALHDPRWLLNRLDVMGILSGVMLLPVLLSALAERYRLGWLKTLSNGALGLMGVLGLLLSWALYLAKESPVAVSTLLSTSVLLLASSLFLRSPKDLDD
ncbi:hypothetical protein [Vitiosangium sp. GDMCC 1.1324]|uniref:hypothetical protein n=1 Tax=Vitiosangium sp. (strain GDMCC 1.1324) TaxID=2138576 RepID=UPI000D37F55C|nr:hypothetical protein [Vitiosangium sp. GDMCC 1.1324]PTL84865.1 hypothetical protein DAT35_07360 [Vitiosangium sp. GDMCC 1.1324]